MAENPFENLRPIVIILSKEYFDRLLAVLEEEPTDEQLAKLAELIISRPQRIKGGAYELR